MTYKIASVGEKVRYREIEVDVVDVGFMDDDLNPTTCVDGDLHYLIQNIEFAPQWVEACECELADTPSEPSFFDEDVRSPHLTDLGYSMVNWMDGLPERPDNSKLPAIVTLLMAIQYDKEGGYGSSWKGKGEYRGIMANIDRKYDRLDKMTQDEIAGTIQSLAEMEENLARQEKPNSGKSAPIGESKIDAIADLTNYGILYMTFVKEHFPRVFAVWVDRNIPEYLRDKIPFV